MQKIKYVTSILMVLCFKATFAQTTRVSQFNKIIISPHIQVTFVQGDEEKVSIEKSSVSNDKINIEVNGKTLRIYLDDAKEVTKNETVYEDGRETKRPIYKGTVVIATLTYNTLDELSVRGEEDMLCKSLLKGDEFRLKLYGETRMVLNKVSLGNLNTTIYGESSLEIKSGSITDQKYTAYGESKINSAGVAGNTAKLTAYGEAAFQVNVKDEIKITSFGNAKLKYKGNPTITKGLNIGGVEIAKID
ncbi:MAG TPA: head GIN domain-containing protein [Segetibacter sp.]